MCQARSTQKKERKTAATCNLLTKGRLFYLCVLLSASEMSHTSENWHCDFQFVREAGWFRVPTDTACLLLSFMKYKSQIRAWRLCYCRARAESPPPRSCSTGHKLPWGLRILVRTRNPLHVSLHLRYVALQRDSTCPYLPVGLRYHHGWECAWMRPCNEPHLWLSSSRPGTEPSFTLLTINHGVTRGTVVLRHRREG